MWSYVRRSGLFPLIILTWCWNTNLENVFEYKSTIFVHENVMWEHFSVSEGVIYDCPMCRLTFVDLKSLKGHVYSHAVNGIFYCPMCSMVRDSVTIDYRSIYVVLRRSILIGIFSMRLCVCVFSAIQDLQVNQEAHPGSTPRPRVRMRILQQFVQQPFQPQLAYAQVHISSGTSFGVLGCV